MSRQGAVNIRCFTARTVCDTAIEELPDLITPLISGERFQSRANGIRRHQKTVPR
jgi:hypothetical protein